MKKNILLLHGWDFNLYSKMTNYNDAWQDYSFFINKLEENYNIYKLNFPGFCKEKEPRKKEWNIDDYVEFVNEYIQKKKINIDIIIGYSFGGAVAVHYKAKCKISSKLFLIAPAITRDKQKSKSFIKTPKILDRFRNIIRDLYVIYIIKNPEMKYGTKFLRNSYQSIVRVDLINELSLIKSKDLCIVYGKNDTAVNPDLVLNKVNDEYKSCIKMIDKANHDDILTIYVNELLNVLSNFAL